MNKVFIGLHISANFFPMVMVISKCRVDVSKRELRKIMNDFVRAHSHLLMPNNDVLNANAMAGDTSTSAAGPRRLLNVLWNRFLHSSH